MNTPTLKTAIFAAETVAHLQGYEREILPLTDLAREMDAEIGKLRAALSGLLDAYAPHRDESQPDKLQSDVRRAVEVLQKPAPPETPQSARPRKCLDDNSRLHD